MDYLGGHVARNRDVRRAAVDVVDEVLVQLDPTPVLQEDLRLGIPPVPNGTIEVADEFVDYTVTEAMAPTTAPTGDGLMAFISEFAIQSRADSERIPVAVLRQHASSQRVVISAGPSEILHPSRRLEPSSLAEDLLETVRAGSQGMPSRGRRYDQDCTPPGL